MVGVEISGLDKLVANAEALVTDIEAWNKKATVENLKDLKEQSILRAPYKTGTLKRSIDYRIIESDKDHIVGVCGSNLPYALIQEVGGTVPAHYVVPKNRNALSWKDPTSPFAATKGNYAGYVTTLYSMIPAIHIKAQPYLFPSLVEGIERFLGRYRAAWAVAGKKGL